MKIIGFNFTKLHAEKMSDNTKGVKIKPHSDISDIKEANAEMLNTQGKILAVKFTSTIDYSPNFAKIDMEGKIVVSVDEDTGKKVLDEWKEGTESTSDFKKRVFNIILKKTSIKALELEEQLNIPLHIPMPKIKEGENK